jgi:hypothetical protein
MPSSTNYHTQTKAGIWADKELLKPVVLLSINVDGLIAFHHSPSGSALLL